MPSDGLEYMILLKWKSWWKFVIQVFFFDSVQNVAPGQARTADIRINNTVNKYGALTDWATGASWEAVPVGISSVAPVQAWYAELCLDFTVWRIGIHDPIKMKKLMNVCHSGVFFDSLQNVAPGQARTADIRITNTVNKYGARTDWATEASWEAVPVGYLLLLLFRPDMLNYALILLSEALVYMIQIKWKSWWLFVIQVFFGQSTICCSRAGSNCRPPHNQYCLLVRRFIRLSYGSLLRSSTCSDIFCCSRTGLICSSPLWFYCL